MSRESVELGELIFPAKVIRCGRDEYPVFSMTMHDGIVEQKTRFKKDLASKDQSNYKVVKPGQLVVGFPIDEGVLYIQQLGKKGIMSPAYNIWDVNQEKVYPEFLELALHSPQSMSWYKAKLRGTTARRRNIPARDLIKLRICLPKKSVQRRIVDTFQQINGELSFFVSLNEKLDDLVKSRFVEMFGNADSSSANFNISTINEICSSIVRGPFGSALKKEFFIPGGVGTYKVYEQKHAIRKRADIGTYYISKEKFDSLKRFECKPGDILMSCSGTMGELYQLPMNCEPGIINQALCKFTLNEKILPEYFFRFMSQVVDDLGAKGSGIKNVSSVKYIKDIKIPLPPLSLQQEFAAFVHQVDKLKFDFDFLVSFSIPSICLFCLKLDP